jgi:hypothetical protein
VYALVGLFDVGVGFEVFAEVAGGHAVGVAGEEDGEFEGFGPQRAAGSGQVLDVGRAQRAQSSPHFGTRNRVVGDRR